MKATEKEKQAAITHLRELLPPGSTIYTVLRHVSKSGMMRAVDAYTIIANEPRRLSALISDACGITYNTKHEALQLTGCGMDMGFHLVQNLSYTLHGMESIGAAAITAQEAGRPFRPTSRTYRAGYSLHHEWL
jgi:hypothetical protein